MMWRPLRNQRPLRPIFLHWQAPGGSSQMLQVRSPGTLVLVRDCCPAALPNAAAVFAAAVFIAVGAGAPSAKIPAGWADAAFCISFSFAECARLFLAATIGLTPSGADAAAVAAPPDNRT